MKIEIILGRLFLIIVSSIIAFLTVDYFSIGRLSSRSPIESKFPVQDIRQPKPYVMFGGRPYSD